MQEIVLTSSSNPLPEGLNIVFQEVVKETYDPHAEAEVLWGILGVLPLPVVMALLQREDFREVVDRSLEYIDSGR